MLPFLLRSPNILFFGGGEGLEKVTKREIRKEEWDEGQ
jgi:hypothetical protein